MKTLSFTKMHGLGNDYIYFNCLDKELDRPEELAIKLSDRHFSIGGDGIVMILPSTKGDFRMRMFNADGSEAEMCGNAVRCIGKYVYDKGLTNKKVVNLETKAGIKILELTVKDNIVDSVRVNMGTPILEPEKIPVNLKGERAVAIPFTDHGLNLPMTCVSMGNPHAIFFVEQITDELVLGQGPKIEANPLFPRKINVEFAKILDRKTIQMRVWERGSGETLACGTGASATAVAAMLNGLTDKQVTVKLLGGDLKIEWSEDGNVYKTGPATIAFEGTTTL